LRRLLNWLDIIVRGFEKSVLMKASFFLCQPSIVKVSVDGKSSFSYLLYLSISLSLSLSLSLFVSILLSLSHKLPDRKNLPIYPFFFFFYKPLFFFELATLIHETTIKQITIIKTLERSVGGRKEMDSSIQKNFFFFLFSPP
jgi:hypothetical protein